MYENVLINFISDRMEYEGQNVIDRHVMYMYVYLYGGRFEESNDASTSHQILYIVYFVYLWILFEYTLYIVVVFIFAIYFIQFSRPIPTVKDHKSSETKKRLLWANISKKKQPNIK